LISHRLILPDFFKELASKIARREKLSKQKESFNGSL